MDGLIEMGFTHQQAQDALKMTGGDVERAIDYLFAESVDVSNKEDIPDFDSLKPDPDSKDNWYMPPPLPERSETSGPGEGSELDGFAGTSEERIESTDMIDDEDDLPSDTDLELEQDDVYSLPEQVKSEADEPTVILNKSLRTPANWISPILQALVQIDEVKYKFQRNANTDFGSKLNKLVSDLDKAGVNYTLNDLEFEEDDSEDLIKKIMDRLAIEQINSYNDKFLQSLVKSEVESTEQNVKQEVECFEIDSEMRCSNIYDSFNQMFWGRNLEELGDIQINNMSDLFTIYYVGDNEPYYNTPLKLTDTFYPEIYSYKLAPKLIEKTNVFKHLNETKIKLTNTLMHLSIFQGKKIDGVLTQVKHHIQDENVLKELNQVSDELTKKKADLTEQISQIIKQIDTHNIKNHEHLIDGLMPYKLILVLLNEQEYYYYNKKLDQWIHIQLHNYQYNQEHVDFQTVFEHIHSLSSRNTIPLYLIYSRAEKLNEEYSEEEIEKIKAQPIIEKVLETTSDTNESETNEIEVEANDEEKEEQEKEKEPEMDIDSTKDNLIQLD